MRPKRSFSRKALLRWTLALSLAVVGGLASADSVRQSETTNGKSVSFTYFVTRAEVDGLTEETVILPEGTTKRYTDAAGSLKRVDWIGPEGHYTLKSDGTVVRATGTFKGKPVSGSVELKGRLWDRGGGVLDFRVPLRAMARQGFQSPVTLVTIAANELDKPVEMVFTKEAEEIIGGRALVRVRLGLSGLLALLWSGQAWADPKTGDQVRLKSTQGPGTPETLYVVEAVDK